MNLFAKGVIAMTGVVMLAGVAQAGGHMKAVPVIENYANIAEAMYQDSLTTAIEMRKVIDVFIAEPTETNLSKAKTAWLVARVPYQQTEVFRFGNAFVDDWEGKVNAWPLDEGLIDYVDASYGTESDENPLYTLNVIATPSFKIGAKDVDASVITPELIGDVLHEAAEVEANVAAGYHAVEFMLWGQDLNGNGPGAGMRRASDFNTKACTNGNCERRAQYLKAVTDLLVADLEDIVAAWANDGEARKQLMNKGDKGGIATILTGLGSLSYGELAGERMKLGLMLGDPEEEHDCFSDNTHNSHYYNQLGMMAIWSGTYERIDGSKVTGASLADFVGHKDMAAKKDVDQLMAATYAKMSVMKETADSGKMSYDQMIGTGNTEGNKIVQDVVDALVAQTRGLQKVVTVLDVEISVEGSDSLDNPSAVQ